jgi:peptidase E
MINIILHGGGDIHGGSLRKLLNEIKKLDSNHRNNPNVLIIPFARMKSEWEKVFEKYKKRYSSLSTKDSFVLAISNQSVLNKQIENSQIIFICGGSEVLLRRYLKSVSFSSFENKVVVGVSAGANIFSRYYYSNDRNKIESGIFKLPVKTLCHFTDQQYEHVQKLHIYKSKESLPLIALKESEFFSLMF